MLICCQVTLSGRFAFVEFRMPEYATAALQLNGQIALMGNTLKIARPSSYVEPTQASLMGITTSAPTIQPGIPAAALPPGTPLSGNLPLGFGVVGAVAPGAPASGNPVAAAGAVAAGGAAGAVADPMATIIPTPFLCVTGMVTAETLASDEEYRERGRASTAEPGVAVRLRHLLLPACHLAAMLYSVVLLVAAACPACLPAAVVCADPVS
eukprot:GHRR01022502.1.p1 GENE.GHRR01022502.1~~GHRR01022502.1.p1  ORF type:complete len:210 (+),score=72.85 GHRR01022502.1:437-1066(+)